MDVLLCKSNDMIASIAFELHTVFKCEKKSRNRANLDSHFKHTLLLTWKVRFFIMQQHRRVMDVFVIIRRCTVSETLNDHNVW